MFLSLNKRNKGKQEIDIAEVFILFAFMKTVLNQMISNYQCLKHVRTIVVRVPIIEVINHQQ